MIATSIYPENPLERSRWIAERRGPRNRVRSDEPYAQMIEEERMEDGTIAQVATIFLTNRECPWKCVMCDLWRNTMPVSSGSIPRQIERALDGMPPARVLKLYNSGSFFDSGAIPKSDWKEIAMLAQSFEHVIVECHPRLVNRSVPEFAEMLDGTLELALGLETCHPEALEKLNKRITVAQFAKATRELRSSEIFVRAFLLVGVPFIAKREQQEWVERSIIAAFDAGVNVVSLIPTRLGNGAMEELELSGDFREPRLADLEAAQEFGLRQKIGRVFADTWDIKRFAGCDHCASARAERLARINRSQQIEARIERSCGH